MELPTEILFKICCYLPLEDLARFSITCKKIYSITLHSSFTKGFFLVDRPSNPSPTPRMCISMTTYCDSLLISGGHGENREDESRIGEIYEDLYQYHIKTKTWKKISFFSLAVTEHSSIVYNNKLWILGGLHKSSNEIQYSNSLFQFDLSNMDNNKVVPFGSGPFQGRSTHSAVIWKNKMYIFGGWNGRYQKWFNDMYAFNFDIEKWELIIPNGIIPEKRCYHLCTIYNEEMYIFGGYSGKSYLNDLWKYSFEKNTWTDLSLKCNGKPPSPRSRAAGILNGNLWYILSGWNRVSYHKDFYFFDFESYSWSQIHSSEIPSLSQHSVAIHNNILYIFGGFITPSKTPSNTLYKSRLEK